MKILLTALPRTRSKWVHTNLNRYLEKNYSYSSKMWIGSNVWTLVDNLFSYHNDCLLVNGHLTTDYVDFHISNHFLDPGEELHNRINVLSKYTGNCVVKIHPNSYESLIAVDALEHTFDRHIITYRKNLFDMCLSNIISHRTGLYSSGDEMNKAIETISQNPLFIDPNHMLYELRFYKSLTDYLYKKYPLALHIDFENLITLKNEKSFCKYLCLENQPMEFDNSFGTEWMEKKETMITNYDTLKKAAKALMPDLVLD